MNPNPALRRLGLGPHDRAVVVHLDDLGMCQATVSAYEELADFGLVTSASVMAPCPWFAHAAERVAARPAADVGVHLTLTSEWPTYRWSPLTTRERSSGLVDDSGYFHRGSQPAHAADPDAVVRELRAQVDRARAAGVRITHVDTHMGTVMHRRLIGGYVELALEHEVPVMFPRLDEEGWRAVSREHPGVSLDDDGAAAAARLGAELEERGVPTFDAVVGLPLESGPSDRVEIAKRALGSLPEGLSHLIIHAATDTPELRAIAPDWRYRVADREAFLSPDLRDWIRDRGLVLLGYEPLRRLMPRRRR